MHNPGDLGRAAIGSVIRGPVVIKGDSIAPGDGIGDFPAPDPAFIVSSIEVSIEWHRELIPMVYVVTPTQFGWTFAENVDHLQDAPEGG